MGECEDDNDHEWRLRSDEIGDADVINGIYIENYFECELCGKTKDASYADLQNDDDLWFDDRN